MARNNPSLPGRSAAGSGTFQYVTASNALDLASYLDYLPELNTLQWSSSLRADILTKLYNHFWDRHPDAFRDQELPPGVLLSQFQAETDPRYGADIPGMPCGRVFRKGECCYKCKDCGLDDSCVLCARCFHASDHEGHNVSFYLAPQPGGCCDCGDREAWKRDVGCAHHPHLANSEAGPPDRSIPSDLRESMTRTIATAITFVLDSLDLSPEQTSPPDTENALRGEQTLDYTGEQLYAVVLWNDEKHSFSDVSKRVSELIGCSTKESMALAELVDYEGRAIVEISDDVHHLFQIANGLTQIDLGVTIRNAYDTFREHMASVIIDWLVDLTRVAVYGTDAITVREVVAAVLFEKRNRRSPKHLQDPMPTENPSRLEWLFVHHTKLWKRPRLLLKDLYISLLNLSHDHKIGIATRFASVYNHLMDAYLLADREAETSVKYFAVQLFTVPTVAEYVVKNNNIIPRLLNIILAFFTNQIIEKRYIEQDPRHNAEINVESSPFRSKRFMPVFSDLRYICTNDKVQDLIAQNEVFLDDFVRLCRIFVGMNPSRRVVDSHVEYETDSWISVFNVTLSLSRVVKVYAEAFSRGTTKALCKAMHTVAHDILLICTLSHPALDTSKYNPIEFGNVEFADVRYRVVLFDVSTEYVSFHHAQHWLLAELLRHVDLLEDDKLKKVGFGSLRDVFSSVAAQDGILTIIEFPLRVLVMVAQIRTGLWVRNGYGIRGQLLHYRDYMLRELCYDQDLFLIQSSLVILDPNTILITLLNRFQLLDWFQGKTDHPSYLDGHLPSMIEEFFYVLITCLSEDASAKKSSLGAIVRREAIHGLALGPCSYTDLCKRVAERIVDEASFDRALEEIANFRTPEGTSEVGIFELKDEIFDEVNPFFFHFTRNRREEIEGILKARLTKKTGIKDPVIVPKPMNITSGPFVALTSTFHSEVLLQILAYGLFNTMSESDASANASSMDAVLDQVLHLVMLALVEQPAAFSSLAAQTHFSNAKGQTLIQLLCTLETLDRAPSTTSKVEWCLSTFEAHVPEIVSQVRPKDKAESAKAKAEMAKKIAAKKRQEAIMKKFAAQQASFLSTLDDEDMMSDEDEAMDTEANGESTPSLGSCILCQEALDQNKVYGALGLVQPSRFRRQIPTGDPLLLADALTVSDSLDRDIPPPAQPNIPNSTDPFNAFPAENTSFGLHASLCGHFMHVECFGGYRFSIEQRHMLQTQRNHPENTDRHEFVCPLCKSLGNVILPVHDSFTRTETPPPQPLSIWIRNTETELLRTGPDRQLEGAMTGFAEFTFWSAEDVNWKQVSYNRLGEFMHHMMQTLRSCAEVVSAQTRHLHGRLEPSAPNRGGGMYLPNHLVAYTIACLEIAQRGIAPTGGSSVVDGINETSLHLVRGLLTSLRQFAVLQYPERVSSNNDATQIIQALRQTVVRRMLTEHTINTREAKTPMLLRDHLTVLVEIAAVAPDALAPATTLMYYAYLARTCVALVTLLGQIPPASLTAQPAANEGLHDEIFGDLRTFVTSVTRHSHALDRFAVHSLRNFFSGGRFSKLIYTFTLPFLRRAAIINKAVHGKAAFQPLSNSSASEYVRLLESLNIPFPSQLHEHKGLQTVLARWSERYGGFLSSISVIDSGMILEMPNVYRMAQLPRALDALFAKEKTLMCHRCKTVPIDAAICLFCGTVCCYQMHCCTDSAQQEQGECNMHTRECGGVVGLYYCVKRCAILYLYAGSGSLAPSPYLDVHGEVDFGMRRGRRQYLHPQRLESLRRLWLSHGIPTYVARKLDAVIDVGGWDSV